MFLSAVSHFSHPVTEIPFPLIRVHEDKLGALHEIGTKPLGPTFGDGVEPAVAAGAVLLWYRERQKFCVHGIIGARQTGASNEHEHQTQFS